MPSGLQIEFFMPHALIGPINPNINCPGYRRVINTWTITFESKPNLYVSAKNRVCLSSKLLWNMAYKQRRKNCRSLSWKIWLKWLPLWCFHELHVNTVFRNGWTSKCINLYLPIGDELSVFFRQTICFKGFIEFVNDNPKSEIWFDASWKITSLKPTPFSSFPIKHMWNESHENCSRNTSLIRVWHLTSQSRNLHGFVISLLEVNHSASFCHCTFNPHKYLNKIQWNSVI